MSPLRSFRQIKQEFRDAPPGMRLLMFLAVVVATSVLGISVSWYFLWQHNVMMARLETETRINAAQCTAAQVGIQALRDALSTPAVGVLTRAQLLVLEEQVKKLNDELYQTHTRSQSESRDITQILIILRGLDLKMIQKLPPKGP